MAQVAQTTEDARQKLKQAVAPAPTRRTRARLFQAYVLVASATFVTLAVLAHTIAYFQLDLTITRLVQSYHGEWFTGLMYALSWIGFSPQCYYIGVVIVAVMFAAGLQWEGVCLAFTMIDTLIGVAIKEIVFRPRPSPDLVHVLSELNSPAFPSGHVLMIVGFGGFLAFLAFTLLKPSPARTILLVVLCAVIALMGLSRIALGQHWFSDVMGAYLLGSLWLALSIRLYRWGKPRFFVHQPVAPDPSGKS
jgi:undecaprenyl-diphosphatase